MRPLRQPRTGNQHTTLISQPQPNPCSPPMIFRRLPASSSFVLAAARLRALQPDPWPRGGKTRAAARKDPEEQSAQPGGARSHRARSVCPLDSGGPYGCRIADVGHSDTDALSCILIRGLGDLAASPTSLPRISYRVALTARPNASAATDASVQPANTLCSFVITKSLRNH